MEEIFKCGHPKTAENSAKNRVGVRCLTCKRALKLAYDSQRRSEISSYATAYYYANREARKAYNASFAGQVMRTNNKAKRRVATGNLTLEGCRLRAGLSGNRCACCRLTRQEAWALGRILVWDHIVPLCPPVGVTPGTNTDDNVQLLCHMRPGGTVGCNNRKGNKTIDYLSEFCGRIELEVL